MSLHGFGLERKLKTGKKEYYGKYRAIVTKTEDPLKMGRIKVKCPAVLGDYESNWCMPCLPPGYVTLPAAGALVWVEFEGGDSNAPIWVGSWYAEKGYLMNGSADKTKIILDTTEEIHLGRNGKAVARKDDGINTMTGKITGGSDKVFAK